jgi:hypothetical protein
MAEQPSTDANVTMLVGRGRVPILGATASMIQGGESVFARIETDTGVRGPERHAARFSLIGPRADLLEILGQLAGLVTAAQVEEDE